MLEAGGKFGEKPKLEIKVWVYLYQIYVDPKTIAEKQPPPTASWSTCAICQKNNPM